MIQISFSAGRTPLATGAGLFLAFAAFVAWRRMRRSTSPYPHPAHPLVLQDAVAQAVAAARADGHLPPDLHGDGAVNRPSKSPGVYRYLPRFVTPPP